MKIMAIRHGETEGNVLHLVESRTGGKLTEDGIRQAGEIAGRLDGWHFGAMYSSDLQHCVDTAEVITRSLARTALILTDKLRERNQGVYEGWYWDDLPWLGREGERLAAKIPDGESWLAVQQRIGAFVNELYQEDPAQEVLFVTHSGPIKVLRALYGGISLRESVDRPVHNGTIWQWGMDRPVLYPTVS